MRDDNEQMRWSRLRRLESGVMGESPRWKARASLQVHRMQLTLLGVVPASLLACKSQQCMGHDQAYCAGFRHYRCFNPTPSLSLQLFACRTGWPEVEPGDSLHAARGCLRCLQEPVGQGISANKDSPLVLFNCSDLAHQSDGSDAMRAARKHRH